MKKTPKMLTAEKVLGEPLELGLPRLYRKLGLKEGAAVLRIPKTTFYYWLTVRLGYEITHELRVRRGPARWV